MDSKINGLILFSILCILLTACHKDEDDKVFVDRTVIVYMAGDNDLSADGYRNIKMMQDGMEKTSGRLVIYFDPVNSQPCLMKIEGGKNPALDTVTIYEEGNSASAATMSEVLKDIQERYPSDSYGLILWSHGMGWLPANYYFPESRSTLQISGDMPRTKYFGEDDNPGDGSGRVYMEIEELARALPGKFSYILFDACFMSSIEVLYELKDKADYFIASPAEVIAEGFPYAEMMPYLWGEEADLKQVCRTFYDYYNNHRGGDLWHSATVSLVRAGELEALALAAKNVLAGEADFSSCWSYPLSNSRLPDVFFDLGDYIRNAGTEEQYTKFKAQLDRTVVYKLATEKLFGQSVPGDKYSGLSTYIPLAKWKNMNAEYHTLAWPMMVYAK